MKFESFCASKIPKEINLKYCGYEDCEPDFKMHPHTRSEYLVHYITKGSGYFTCEGSVYKVSQGDLFMILPLNLVSYHTDAEQPLEFYWFAFSGESAETFVEQLGFSSIHLIRKLHPQYSIKGAIESLVEYLDAGKYCNEFKIQSILYSILANISESYHLSNNYAKENTATLFGHIEKAKSYIKCNYIYPITVKDVATHVGLERSYFSKIFHKNTGFTAQNYILHIRIQRSKLLLERTDYTVKEICSYVGMKDEYYFSRVFKQSTGVSPTQYRHQESKEIVILNA